MQVQFKHEIRRIEPGVTARFDLLKSNATFRNPMAIVYPLVDVASYRIRIYFDDILYPELNVNRNNERSFDMLVLTPENRFLPPTLAPGLPGNSSNGNPFHAIPVIVTVANVGAEACVFYVAVTWEASPPRGTW